MNVLTITSSILALLLSIITIRSYVRRTKADADHSEIENIRELIKTWREEKEASDKLNMTMREELDLLRKDVQKMRLMQRRILDKLDKITHQNMEKIIQQIKQEIQHDTAD
jgi:DNA-binding transcriptional MerR regulator